MSDTQVLTPANVELCRQMAGFFRMRGFNPVPSEPPISPEAKKKPMCRMAQWWESPVPDDLFDRFVTCNLQVMTGRHWRLLVMDLDGPEARAEFDRLAREAREPLRPTWATHSGGGGIHLWFRLAAGITTPLPKAVVWKGDGDHSAIERLCDRSLIMAPPSIHPRTGERYRFLDRAHSPARLPLPANCPGWVLGLRPTGKPAPAPVAVGAFPRPAIILPRRGDDARYRAADVIEGIGDKLGLAASWGVRVASRPNHAGWASCHAIGREDRTPSAAVSATTGRYWEPGERTISLFELGVRLGIYHDFKDAIADLGSRYRIREAG